MKKVMKKKEVLNVSPGYFESWCKITDANVTLEKAEIVTVSNQ